MMKIINNSGIYKILNWSTNKFYIGSAVRLRHRLDCHKSELRANKHRNSKLQNAWNKYGEKDFTFHVLEHCEKYKLLEREQYYTDTLKPEYNILLIANSSLGYKHTEEAIAKMKEIGRNQPISDKAIKAMSNAVRGKSKSYEHKSKISLTKTGISCSNERKENIRKTYHDRTAKQILTNILNPMRIQNGD